MNSSELKLLKNGLLSLVLIVILDISLGSLIEHFLFSEEQGDSSVVTHAILKSNEDIVVFGSSRAGHHYIPEIVENRTNLSCFNVGRAGEKMLYYESLLKAVLAYHTPKIVILDLNLNDFVVKEDQQVSLISNFLPYINENKVIEEILYNESKIEYWKGKISKLYRLNSLPMSIVQHHLGIGHKKVKGYESLTGSNLSVTQKEVEDNTSYREGNFEIQAFENFVRTVVQKKIQLYVVISPTLRMPKYNCIKTANKILARYGLKCHDYSDFFDIKSKELFFDDTHLNNSGATAFTKQFIADQFNMETKLRAMGN